MNFKEFLETSLTESESVHVPGYIEVDGKKIANTTFVVELQKRGPRVNGISVFPEDKKYYNFIAGRGFTATVDKKSIKRFIDTGRVFVMEITNPDLTIQKGLMGRAFFVIDPKDLKDLDI